MDPTLAACLRSWSFDPWLCGGLAFGALIYLRGSTVLRGRGDGRQGGRQIAAYLLALGMIVLAVCSPIDTFSGLVLTVHMIQHLLLMIVAPILIWLARPQRAFELGLPRFVVEEWFVPLRRQSLIRWTLNSLGRPIVAWCLFAAAMWIWHVPALYELALRSTSWHRIEHVSFLFAGLLFWRPVIGYLLDGRQPSIAGSRRSDRPYWLLPYLFLADLQGTLLSAALVFSGRVIYPHYASVPRIGNFDPLLDQSLAGALMWVLASAALLLPLALIGYRLLIEETADRSPTHSDRATVPALLIISDQQRPAELRISPRSRVNSSHPARFDLLRAPLVGRVLRSARARIALRLAMLLLAMAIVVDGFTGPQVSPMNLAGVLPWIHWRGFAVFGLLAAGNVVCLGCPLTLSRSLWRTRSTSRWHWPSALQNKWLAVALLIGFFVCYEVFDLWSSPWWTAWIVVGYFTAAIAIDALFHGAAFCKYVCPIGQFQFVMAQVAPLQVKVRDAASCAGCQTHACIQGRDSLTGCELELFLPAKNGNLDCTLCLDCVDACPHDNIGLMAVSPVESLARDGWKAGIGRLSRRLDLAALAAVLVFAAFANAAGMVRPVARYFDRVSAATGSPLWLVEATAILVALIPLPLALVSLAAVVDRRLSRSPEPLTAVIARTCWVLVPLGAGMWLAHYGFHFLMGADAFVPATVRFAADWTGRLGTPDWRGSCCAPVSDGVLKFEILALEFGLLTSLYLGYRITTDRARDLRQALGALLPWAGLIVVLFVIGIWVVFQPMEMRGMLPSTGGAG